MRNYNSITGEKYEGLRYEEGNCGVSVMRSGEKDLEFLNSEMSTRPFLLSLPPLF